MATMKTMPRTTSPDVRRSLPISSGRFAASQPLMKFSLNVPMPDIIPNQTVG